MNMKKFTIYILLLAAFGVSCSEDETSNTNIPVSDIQELSGEWVAPNSSNTYYTFIGLQDSHKATYYVVQNALGSQSVTDKDEGTWRLYTDRVELIFNMMWRNLPTQSLIGFKDDCMTLRSNRYNTTDKFYRVVEDLNLEAGQTAPISYLSEAGLSGAELTSTNPEIATVSADGVVRAIQEGTAFISVKQGETLVFVKVEVNGRIGRFAAETHLLITDIVDKYGMPDGVFVIDEEMDGLYYMFPDSDPDMYALQYRYNKYTSQINMVQTVYNAEDAFVADWSYLEEFFYRQYDWSDYSYTQNERIWSNEYIVTVRVQSTEPSNWITYTNLDYDY